MQKNLKLAASFIAVLTALAVSGCNTYENPDPVDTTDTADNGPDVSVSVQGTDVSSADAGNTADVSNDSAPDVQQVEVEQEVSAVDAGPKPECAVDADCNNNNPCTTDICGNGGKCVHVATSSICDDDNACTDNDVCANSKCKGTAKVCDDNNLCTDDFCMGGKCFQGVNSMLCDDTNACTTGDQCSGGQCQGGAAKVCDDKNLCTEDSCDTKKGCDNAPIVCEDNNPCTDDVCNPKTGICKFSQKVCEDGKANTYDDCDSNGWYGEPGQCVFQEKWNACGQNAECEDGNPCTFNVCNSLSGTCDTVQLNCNDNNPCTTDSCVPAKGCVNSQKVCDDSNSNTTDTCDSKNGACVYTPVTNQPPANPPPIGTVNVSVSCGAVACEDHLYFGKQVDGSSFDNFGTALANSSFSADLPKSQLCSWGLEVAARLNTATWPWFGCDPTAPSLNTLVVKINGVIVPGVLTKHAWTCGGGGEGNLAFSKAQLSCP